MLIGHDPVEDTPEYKAIEKELDQKIRARIGDKRGLGFCHIYWIAKKNILKTDYGIDWQSPAELNPHIIYD